ncbi:aminotransferase class I/II-fold pyridoxal phosphate-dependent enzyme [Candidatus Woesearchaeota archaeon]|nr:aminotransferase class I/II-fold pyridoxal phosphate-dependent enzyme [Candidatus Woesearchaeota archaeon]
MLSGNSNRAGIQEKLCWKLAQMLKLRHVVLFSSCRNALYTLLCSLHLQKDDEVIIQSFICDSLTLAITKGGAIPKLVDVNPHTLNLDAESLEKQITLRTKVVIFVHTYGNPSGIREVADLCRRRNVILIEDIAHALGARYDQQNAGTFGDYAVYSFTKQMVNIGGGALFTNHDVGEIVRLQQMQNGKASFSDFAKRLFGSLYETRAFWLSKLLIDFVRKRADLRLAQELSLHAHCSVVEAQLAYWQVESVVRNVRRKRANYLFLKQKNVRLQEVDPRAESACSYLAFYFKNQEQRDQAVRKQFLFLPPWPGTAVSQRLLFVPNRVSFSKRKLLSFAEAVEDL